LNQPVRARIRIAAVIALALFAIVFSASDIVLPWHPYGAVGFTSNRRVGVTSVTPNSHAAKMGVRVGDRINFFALGPLERAVLNFNGTVMFGAAGSTQLHSSRRMAACGRSRWGSRFGIDRLRSI